MTKGKFLVFALIFLVLSLTLASADLYVKEEINKDYTTDVQKITYVEDLKGANKGFSLTITSTSPKYSYKYEDDYPYITWGYIQPRYGYSDYEPSYKYYDRTKDYLEPALYTYRLGKERYYAYKYPYYRYSYRNYGYRYSYPYYGSYGGYGGYGYQRNYW